MEGSPQKTIPDFHDGSFDGILIPNDDAIRLFVRTLDGKGFSILLEGVEAFKMFNVREGNTILDVTILDSDQLSASHIELAYTLSEEGKSEQVSKLLRFAQQNRLKMFQMDSSYGAECIALCRNAELRDETWAIVKRDNSG
jgi:hypothetical protein